MTTTDDDLASLADRLASLDPEAIRAELERTARRDRALRVLLRASLASAREREQERLADLAESRL